MNSNLEEGIVICNQIIDLLEDDYRELYNSFQGEIYEEYKLFILEEIERVEKIKQAIKMIS